MANEANECAHLEVDELHSEGLTEMMERQAAFQEFIGSDFKTMSIKELAEFWMKNKHAFDDEFGEALDALGGIKKGIGSAGWKWWKKDHIRAANMKISDLYGEDLTELKFEVVDMLHFLLNFAVSIGMTGDELFSMYVAKNKENMGRQERGY